MRSKLIVIGMLVVLLSLLMVSAEEKSLTKSEAMENISDAKAVIIEMKENSFSTSYMDDMLIEAERTFEQAEYAEILRSNISDSHPDKVRARTALRLIDWKSINYSNILFYINEINNRKERAFLISDKIVVEETRAKEGLSEETLRLLDDAKTAFYDDRYDEAEELIEEFQTAFETESAGLSTLSGLRTGTKSFFEKNWLYILIVIIFLSFVGYFLYKYFEKKIIKRKITRMKHEKVVLMRLIKRTQEDRFKKNIISGLVYNIRIKHYKERMQEIKQDLPVLEKRLEKSTVR